MRKYHRYEYNLHKKHITLFYLSMSSILLVMIVTVSIYLRFFENDELGDNLINLQQFCNETLRDTRKSTTFGFLLFGLATIQLSFLSLILVWIVIRVKPSSDLLQGLSKLDYLLKVSIF